MKLASFNPVFADAVRKLARALADLDQPVSPRGRRLSRSRVVRRLASIREVMNTTYPAPARKQVERSRKTPEQRLKALLAAGWVDVGIEKVSMAAQAGVRAQKIVVEKPRWQGYKVVGTETETTLLLPKWAADAPSVAAMKALKASRGNTRKVMLVDIALKKRTSPKSREVQL